VCTGNHILSNKDKVTLILNTEHTQNCMKLDLALHIFKIKGLELVDRASLV